MDQTSTSDNKNKYILYGVVAIAIIIAIYFWKFAGRSKMIGEDISVMAYTQAGQTIGGMFSVPFLTEYPEQQGVYVSGAVDLNGNQSFESDEWLVKNGNTQTQKDWNTNLSFKTNKTLSGDTKVRVVVSDAKASDDELASSKNFKEKTVTIQTQNLDESLGTTAPTKPGESMKKGPETA